MSHSDFIPSDVSALCNTLREAGFSAFPVGGAVRDLALGRTPDDWDVATSARPEQTAALFGGYAQRTGAAHGTVTVSTPLRAVEVTTFRREGPYSDHRRPDWVEFVDSITLDLARRDLTINAMALDERGELIDPFGGQNDLRRRVLRTVGDPKRRFAEDGLRLFRAVRFSAQLDFELGEDEWNLLTAHPEWGAPVSAERVRIELERGICAPFPRRLTPLFAFGLLEHFVGTRCQPDLAPLAALPPEPCVRWAGLCRALAACGAATDAETLLRAFHMDKRTRRGALTLLCER